MQIDSELWFLWQQIHVAPMWFVMRKNGVSTFTRVFSCDHFSYLQVKMTCMKAQTISNFGLIEPLTAELAALEHLKKSP